MSTQSTATTKLFIELDIHKKGWSFYYRTHLFHQRGFAMPPEHAQLQHYNAQQFTGHQVGITNESDCYGFGAAR